MPDDSSTRRPRPPSTQMDRQAGTLPQPPAQAPAEPPRQPRDAQPLPTQRRMGFGSFAPESARTMILSSSDVRFIESTRKAPIRDLPELKEEQPPPTSLRQTLAYSAKRDTAETPMDFSEASARDAGGIGAEMVSVGRPPPVKIEPLELPAAALTPRLVMLTAPDSSQAALYRVLRRRLIERGAGKCIMVTSAERHEGKTICALNLAMALAEGGRARVLLVEANLRTPAIAQILHIEPPECFAVQLHEVHPGDDRLWKVGTVGSPWLHLLAVRVGAASEPLNRLNFEAAMEQLRRIGYDFIVVDAPPVLGSADTLLMEDLVDGVLLTTMGRRSRATALRSALEQLTPTKVAGVALLDA